MRRQAIAWRRKPQVLDPTPREALDFLKTKLRRSDTVAKPLTTTRCFSNRRIKARPCRPHSGAWEKKCCEEEAPARFGLDLGLTPPGYGLSPVRGSGSR
jgi:hypothetical protein